MYIALPAVEVGGGTFSFEIPRDATRIQIVIKGDTNSNGSVTSADIARLNAYLKNKVDLTSEVLFAADVNSDGNVNEADIQCLSDAILGKSTLPW